MPNLKLKYIIDENGDRVAPITHIDAVRNSNGDSLTSLISPENLGNGIGTCSTSSGTALTVSLTGYELVLDGFVAVTFTNDVPADATLNVNGKGAKSIIYKGSAITADTIKANDTITFCYDGTNYVVTSLGGEIPTFTGATSSANGSKGLVPAPLVADKDKFLKGDGTWSEAGGNVKIIKYTGTCSNSTYVSSGTTFYIKYVQIDPSIAYKVFYTRVHFSNAIQIGNVTYLNIASAADNSTWVTEKYCQGPNFKYSQEQNYSSVSGPHLYNVYIITMNNNPGTVTYELFAIE